MKLVRIMSAFAFSVALVTPVVVQAQPRVGMAMFDDQHRDFTANDEKAWHEYLKEKHKKDHDWAKATKREQSDYWKWRDAHPDSH